MVSCTEGRPYLICTVDHQGASHLLSSFTVPIDLPRRSSLTLNDRLSLLPDTLVGPNALAGVVSVGGRYLAVVECRKSKDFVKVLTFRKGPDGDLGCSTQVQMWRWKSLTKSACASPISIAIQEEEGTLEVIAVDGQGHVISARVDAANVQPYESLRSFSCGEASTSKLQSRSLLLAGELSSEESSRQSTLSETTQERMPRTNAVAD